MGHEKNTSEKGGPNARNSPLWIRICDMSKLIIIFFTNLKCALLNWRSLLIDREKVKYTENFNRY